jgi:hypothetical protein
MYAEDIEIHGRFNADGEFEAFDSAAVMCESCGSPLLLADS